LLTSDGKLLRSRPLGLSYFDGSNSVFISELKHSIGQVLPSGNQVIYTNAFTGFAADLVLTYHKGGFESDLVFREQPPTPQSFGLDVDSQLELLTEFFDTPEPKQTKSKSVQAKKTSDTTLTFGNMQMVRGKAFEIGKSEETTVGKKDGIPVDKTWAHINGRTFLIEAVSGKEMNPKLQNLPQPPTTAAIPATNSFLRKVSSARLIPPSRIAQSSTNTMRIAKLDLNQTPGVVLDYTILDGTMEILDFQSNTTYYVSGFVSYDDTNTVTFEGGAVLKYATNASLLVGGQVVCLTGPANPVVFTAVDDNSVGEIISTSTGVPSGFYANPSLQVAPMTQTNALENFRVYYAEAGLSVSDFIDDGFQVPVRNCQFINCDFAFAYKDQVALENCLFYNVATVFQANYVSSAGNITAHGVNTFLTNSLDTLGVTNSLFISVTNLGDPFSGAYNATNANDTGVFKSAGMAVHYLATSSAYRDAGTTNLSANLLATLQSLTTYAPQDGGYLDNNSPDLGFHYSTNEDSDFDGLPDWWEIQYFGNCAQSGAGDFDGDGLSNLQEYLNGSNPTDYYNGVLPLVTITGGNNQSGMPNTILPFPLTISVTATNGTPLTNAPITFAVSQGSAQIAVATNGTFSSSTNLLTDPTGHASVFVRLSSVLNVTNLMTATAWSGSQSNQVTFTEMTFGGIQLWLKADAGITFGTGNAVSLWADQGGLGNNASQTTASKRALLITNALNGLPVVRFDGLDDDFGFAPAVLNTTTQAEAFVILKTSATGHPLWYFGVNASSIYNASDGSITEGFGSTSGQFIVAPTQPLGQYHMYNVAAATNLWIARINGQLQFQNNVNTYPPQGLDIGWKGSGSSFFAGDIAEVLIFNRVLSADERYAVGTYLNSKYAFIPAPQAPTNLVATPLSPGQISLTWTFSLTNTATTLQIERKTGSGGTYAQIAQLQDASSYVDTNLTAGTQYYYRVRASDLAGVSSYSNETNATTFAAGTVLPFGDLRLWLKADGAMIKQSTNRNVEYWYDQSGNTNDGSQTTASKQTFWVDNAINGRPIVRFDGVNKDFGFFTPLFNATTQAEAFVVLKASAVGHPLWYFGVNSSSIYNASDSSITEGFGGTSGQYIGISTQPLNQFHLYNVSAATNLWVARINGQLMYRNNVNTFPAQGLDIGWGGPGGAGFFSGDIAEVLIFSRVLTGDERNAVGTYLNSKYAFVPAPQTPTNLIAAALSTNQIGLTWNFAITNFGTSFQIERKTGSGGTYVQIAQVDGTSYVDTNLAASTQYYYRVKANDFAGPSGYSNETNATTSVAGTALPLGDLRLWLRADAPMIREGPGQKVEYWFDQSGNTNDGYQTTASKQSSWVDNAINGRPIIRFDGSGDDFGFFTPVLSATTQAEAFVVLKANATGHPLWYFGVNSSSIYNAADGSITEGFGSTSGQNIGVPSQPLSQYHLYNVAAATNLWVARINGQLQYQNNVNTYPVQGLDIGWGGFGGAGFFSGDIAEVLIFNRVLNNSERASVLAYINRKYILIRPSVTLTSPTNNTVIIAGSNLNITATASDAAGTVTQVQFFQGSTSIGIVTNSPYSLTWSNVTAGIYSLSAQVTDDQGLMATSQVVSVIADIPPSVTLTNPVNGALIAANTNILLAASASDADGTVARVEFFQGTNSLGVATNAPFNLTWSNVPPANYALTARATDNNGITTTSSVVNITVNVAPSVTLITPTNNSIFMAGSNIPLSANASTSEGVVTQVQFFQGTNNLGVLTNAPYNLVWSNVVAGSYALTAQATGDDGLSSTSAVVSITVDSPPTVSITLPTNNSVIVPAYTNVTVTATASDSDGTVSQVQFFQGTTLLGTDGSSPYTLSWSNMPPGVYGLTAQATDNNGIVSTSAVVNVTVAGVFITSPTNYVVYAAPATVPLAAATVDNVGISQVQYFQGATSLGIKTNSPYSLSWTNVAAGVYSLTAVATDASSRVLTSRPINVIVDTTPSSSDRDGDGVSDAIEYLLGRNPLGSNSVSDVNGILNLQIYTPLK